VKFAPNAHIPFSGSRQRELTGENKSAKTKARRKENHETEIFRSFGRGRHAPDASRRVRGKQQQLDSLRQCERKRRIGKNINNPKNKEV
jgi:hypothetical protein